MKQIRLYIHHLGKSDGLQTEQLERMLPDVNSAAITEDVEIDIVAGGFVAGRITADVDLCILPGAPERVPQGWLSTGLPKRIPYVVFDSADGCELTPPVRELLRSEHPPAAVWKHYRFGDPALYNRFGGRWHQRGDDVPLPPQIPVERLSRIKAPFGYGAYSGPRGHQRKQIGRDVLLEGEARAANRGRPIDVSFCGNVWFNGDAIEEHRKACCAAIRALPAGVETCVVETGLGYASRLKWKEYVDLLYVSKIVVSPFGGGEACFRDFEAVYAGCIVIKPTEKTIDVPSCLWPCLHDFTRLAGCVGGALLHLSIHGNEIVMRNRKQVVDDNSPATVGRCLWQEIKEAIG